MFRYRFDIKQLYVNCVVRKYDEKKRERERERERQTERDIERDMEIDIERYRVIDR